MHPRSDERGMGDVYCLLRKQIPFTVRLKGEDWHISAGKIGKRNRQYALNADCWRTGKGYSLAAGDGRAIDTALARGFLVKGGTPQRGLATALRRANVATLHLEPQPKPAWMI